MSDSSQPTPDRRRRGPQGGSGHPDDLEALVSHPSLAPLVGQGRRLDRLPTARTAWAIAGTLALSLAALGPVAAGFVTVVAVLAVAFTVSALSAGNFPAARQVLDVTRLGLLAWVLISATVLWFNTPGGAPAPPPRVSVGVNAGAGGASDAGAAPAAPGAPSH